MLSLILPILSWGLQTDNTPLVRNPIQQINEARLSYYESLEDWAFQNSNSNKVYLGNTSSLLEVSNLNWVQLGIWLLMIVYIVGVLILLSKIIWTFKWLYELIRKHPSEFIDGATIIKIKPKLAPFSFMKYVFVHESILDTQDYDKILMHELTHVKQRHSIDLIFVQLVAAFFWFNPIVWQLIKSLKTTHEYIADKKTISMGYSLVEYQTLLLRQLISNNSYGLVHNFNLSFIKKRIAMMKNKKSGKVGKVKVAFVLMSTLVIGLLVVQCNQTTEKELIDQSELDALVQSELEYLNASNQEINLPVLPASYYSYDYDISNAIVLEIINDQVKLDGSIYDLDQLASTLKSKDLSNDVIVVMKIDADQTMKTVREVQMVLRKADKRKLLYIGQTADGQLVNSAMLLPPAPGQPMPNGIYLPTIDDAYAEANDIDILKFLIGEVQESEPSKRVYDFVKEQIEIGKSNYVVCVKFDNNNPYSNYLQNLLSVHQGFNLIYEELSQKMFGVNFYEIDKELIEGRAQYDAVRKGIPRAISIAEE